MRETSTRKQTLVDYGFRLPSAKDNRPLNFEEFEDKIDQILFVSATPGEYEENHELLRAEQIIRYGTFRSGSRGASCGRTD